MIIDIGDIGALLLEGPEKAADFIAGLTAKLGEGVGWTGEQIETFAVLVGLLAAKLDELQAQARDDEPAAS